MYAEQLGHLYVGQHRDKTKKSHFLSARPHIPSALFFHVGCLCPHVGWCLRLELQVRVGSSRLHVLAHVGEYVAIIARLHKHVQHGDTEGVWESPHFTHQGVRGLS